MTLLFDKVASSFTYPLGFAVVGIFVALLTVQLGARRSGMIGALLLTSMLWVASTPIFARATLAALEVEFPAQRVEVYETAEVAIVIGGGLRPPNAGNPYPDLAEASDRLLHAYRIFKAGKARRIVLSGGVVFDGHALTSEAEAMADFLVSLGVDRSALIIEPVSRSTHENALACLKIWRREGFTSGLLITSALHMPRALATFRKEGMVLQPASTDALFGSIDEPLPLSILPDSRSLDQTTKALKEWLGLFVYRYRGWA